MLAPTATSSRFRAAALFPAVAASVAIGIALWAYWPTLVDMAWRWGHDPQYSHGYLVPAFALYLLWTRRSRLAALQLSASAWGLLLLVGAMGLRLAGAYFHYPFIDQVSLLPCVAGIILLVGGRGATAWSWPAVAFLAFMVPLPHSWALALSGQMQSIATVSSTFVLQVLGRPALAEGNVIQLNEIELGIVEACSGLRMLVVFFALSTAVAMLIQKPLWERLTIALSAVPIALVSNILRITATGIIYENLGDGYGGQMLHDVAGWLMMPLGLIFLGLELWVLKNLLREPATGRPLPSQVTMQRVEVNPVTMYRGESRRSRRAVPPAETPAADSTEKQTA